jgi:serine/threonine protein kinase
MTSPALSQTRLGSFELIRPLSSGGMADVFLVRHQDRELAIKVLNKRRANDSEAHALFRDEARILALLDHANITTVHEIGETGGVPYLAMEYVNGVDLRQLLADAMSKHRLVDYDAAMSIMCGAAAGLDHAHRRCSPEGKPLHLVHRDVSLSNIMVGHSGAVKVVDFGIATTTMSSIETAPGTVRGKASYMSPEQCLGDPVDHRTDVFALGVVLYELTTGERCFHGRTDFERMLAVVRGEYTLPSKLVPDYPLELEQVIRTALSIDANLRYPSAAAMIDALERVALGRNWALGAGTIARMMTELYDDMAIHVTADMIEVIVEPGPIDVTPDMIEADAPLPTLHQAPVLRPRLARGTDPGFFSEPWRTEDPDEALTRGRRSMPRILALA